MSHYHDCITELVEDAFFQFCPMAAYCRKKWLKSIIPIDHHHWRFWICFIFKSVKPHHNVKSTDRQELTGLTNERNSTAHIQRVTFPGSKPGSLKLSWHVSLASNYCWSHLWIHYLVHLYCRYEHNRSLTFESTNHVFNLYNLYYLSSSCCYNTSMQTLVTLDSFRRGL